MASIKSGISTSGLASSPPPAQAFSRRHAFGEYQVNVTLSSSGRLELITTKERLDGLIRHLDEVVREMIEDERRWDLEISELENPHAVG